MAHFDTEGKRLGSVTDFGELIEQAKRLQYVFDIIEEVEPLIDELYDNIHLFESDKDLYNAIVDLYVNLNSGREIIKITASDLKNRIYIDS